MTGPRYRLDELEAQTSALPTDLLGLVPDAAEQVRHKLGDRPGTERIVVLGSGDSLNAAIACGPAFARIGRAEYLPMSPTEYLTHPPARVVAPDRVTVVGVSATGGNPSLVTAVTAARDEGCPTIAVTANAESPLAAAAGTVLRLALGPLEPSPGIRTYQASLVGLLHLADGLGAAGEQPEAELLAAAVDRSIALARPPVAALLDDLAAAPVVLVVGSGAGLGTARHVAAKITESAGRPAAGVELEDWWHVHRFGHDRRHPVLFIATPGPARAAVLATARRTLPRRPVILVAAEDDREARDLGVPVIPVAAGVPDAQRPLVDHVFAGPLAAGLADRCGVLPFANP
ncbi:SIS domain-containing protein [Dactylosporangium sp. NPDC051541]|uniref:SIS domain-containing protein n=1 Tax=Dactylosporangium sp. NPDC051541 TaxID=3363977 RepID=UPI0037A96B1B